LGRLGPLLSPGDFEMDDEKELDLEIGSKLRNYIIDRILADLARKFPTETAHPPLKTIMKAAIRELDKILDGYRVGARVQMERLERSIGEYLDIQLKPFHDERMRKTREEDERHKLRVEEIGEEFREAAQPHRDEANATRIKGNEIFHGWDKKLDSIRSKFIPYLRQVFLSGHAEALRSLQTDSHAKADLLAEFRLRGIELPDFDSVLKIAEPREKRGGT